MTDRIFKLGELFSGPGGLALGAGLARKITKDGKSFSISHVWGVDKAEDAIETYRHNICNRFGGDGICMDANAFCRNSIAKYPKITALAFGFPCNDYSRVGEHKGMQGKYGNLYKAGVSVIEECNPFWFIAENVSGIHSANSGEAFKRILLELGCSGKYGGYELTTHLYKFEEYGVPQYRHRYIIVGIRKDQKLKFMVPAPTHGKGIKPLITAGKAINGLSIDTSENIFKDERVILRLKFIPPWHNAWYLDELMEMPRYERKQILQKLPWYEKEFSELSDKIILEKIDHSRLRCTRARMSHIYKRLDKNRPSYTVTGSGGGGTHIYHWREHRPLTNKERAKLQGFPEGFEFQGLKEQIRKQIGMAVPPIAAKIIFEAILKTFAGINYRSITPSYS